MWPSLNVQKGGWLKQEAAACSFALLGKKSEIGNAEQQFEIALCTYVCVSRKYEMQHGTSD